MAIRAAGARGTALSSVIARVLRAKRGPRGEGLRRDAGAGLVVTPAIELRHLSFHYDDGTPAFEDVSLRVAEGECVALIGPNGAGKSTLLLHVIGLLPEPGQGHGEGEVLALRRAPRHGQPRGGAPAGGPALPGSGRPAVLSDGRRGRRVRAAAARAPRRRAEAERRGRARAGRPRRVRAASALTGSAEARRGAWDWQVCSRTGRECSSSTSRRAASTRALGASSSRSCAAFAATRLLATHDLALVAETCTRTIVLDGGRVVADGPTKPLLRDDELMIAHGLEGPRRDLPAGLLDDEAAASSGAA